MMRKTILVALVLCATQIIAQNSTNRSFNANNAEFNQWHMLDLSKDGIPGIAANRAYEELLKGKKSTPVVVAIIDSGTETFHEDLRDNIWVNTDEIADNGIDDDKNGYVDDIHGWSFLGGANGDVAADNLEFTRIYRELKNKFGNVVDASTLPDEDKKEYERYLVMKERYTERMQEAEEGLMNYMMVSTFMENADEAIRLELGKESYTLQEVEAIEPKDDFMQTVKTFMSLAMKENFTYEIQEAIKQYETMVKYQLNLDFDPRNIVGDNYNDVSERFYGNNHVDGPEGEHGTHVGGIVGAVRNNVGMNGVASNVQLMVIRCVPNGDERDKDVANSIRYAADNGARVINMSFGKSFSPQKSAVDDAVKYAESKGVLLVHAAGNDAKNIDVEANFPKDKYDAGGYCSTWLEIGASGPDVNNLVADFSNYGKQNVDVFAPGVEIYSTVPGSSYHNNSGTSMASPVAAGVAATIMSYFPGLTAQEVKEIMMKSATDYRKLKVIRYKERSGMGKFFARIFIGKKKNESSNPALREFKPKKVRFSEYSVTGGVINLYEAIKLAETRVAK